MIEEVRTNMNSRSDCSGDRSQPDSANTHCSNTVSEDRKRSYSTADTLGFAERILELELRLQTECSLPLIRALMDSYTVCSKQEAIEHWECLGDSRHLRLQDRMHWLLRRKDVAAVLNSASKQRKTKPLANLPVNLGQNQTDVHTEQSYFPQTRLEAEGKPKRAEDLLSSAVFEAKSAVEKVQEDLKAQNEGLLRRLEVRKLKIAVSKPKASTGTSPDGECEEPPPSLPKPAYEDALEALLEQLFEKRLEAKREVAAKYYAQVQELQGSCSPLNALISQVITQVGKAEAAETAELETSWVLERTRAVAALRTQYSA